MHAFHGPKMALSMLLAVAPLAAGAEGFTEAQATRGKALFNAQCSQCHGTRLQGVNAPALSEETMQNFATAAGLHDMITVAMPPQKPGALQEQTYLDIIAYILYFNGAQPGDTELTDDPAQLASIDLVAATSGPSLAETGTAADSENVPQAYTWGEALPGSETAAAEASASESDVPQAFTWGKDLPSTN